PLPALRRWHELAGRPADPGGPDRCALLPGRDRRSAQRHHADAARADTTTPDAADRAARHDGAGAPGLPARRLVQPRLPGDREGPQAVDAAAFPGHRLRLPEP